MRAPLPRARGEGSLARAKKENRKLGVVDPKKKRKKERGEVAASAAGEEVLSENEEK